jgi:uncharacterized protein (TIGR04255 family)
MDNYEVFKKPSVVEVVFEIRFPQLFNIEQKISDFQLEIMDDFPLSDQIYEQSVQIPSEKPLSPLSSIGNVTLNWQFQSSNQETIIILKSNRLNIISKEYKSYNHPDYPKFRDVIQNIVSKFLTLVPIKKFERIGLRYIDICPLDQKTNEYFEKFYRPNFDINQFKVEDIIENLSFVRIKREPHNLLFKSGIRTDDKGIYIYFMDFDGYSLNVPSEKFLEVTDDLKRIIYQVYFDNITENFKNYMREDKK